MKGLLRRLLRRERPGRPRIQSTSVPGALPTRTYRVPRRQWVEDLLRRCRGAGRGHLSQRYLRGVSEPEGLSVSGRRRATLAIAAVLAVYVTGIFVSLTQRQVFPEKDWVLRSEKQYNTTIEVQGVRAAIFDSEGRILALSGPSLSIGVHPSRVNDPAKTARVLYELLYRHRLISPEELVQQMTSSKPFTWLVRGAPVELEEQLAALRLPGIVTMREMRRVYPQGTVASPILGRLNVDGHGLSGLELAFDSALSGASRRSAVERDARRRLVPAGLDVTPDSPEHGILSRIKTLGTLSIGLLADGDLPVDPGAEPQLRLEGNDVRITINSIFQQILEQECDAGNQTAEAEWTSAVLLDPDSGDVLALAQSPRFDPNDRKSLSPEHLRNVAIQDAFEPGSIIKPLVAALALDKGLVRTDEAFNCDREIVVGGHAIQDVHLVGATDLRGVLVQSSNVCMAKIGERLGKERLYEGLRKLGFGQLSGIELSGENAGIVAPASRWGVLETATHAFGQGFSVTLLQAAEAYATLANGGRRIRPRLLATASPRSEGERIVSSEASEKVLSMLRGVVEDEHGTARVAAIDGVLVSGKTGTAQQPRKGGKGYSSDHIVASFAGIIDPINLGIHRRFVLVVAVNHPGVTPRWGGKLAAPIFRKATERILQSILSRPSYLPRQPA